MANQTTRLNGSPGHDDAAGRRNIGDLAHDVVELVELQSRLFMLDARESAKTSLTGAMLVLAGAILLLSGASGLIFALGWVLFDVAGWSRSASFAVAGGAGLLISGILAWLGVRKLRSGINTFRRSGRELSQNLQWFRDTWKRDGRAPGDSFAGQERMTPK